MNKYCVLKDKQQKVINDFPMFFAFSEEQFEEGMKKLGVESSKDIVSIGFSGFIRASDMENFGQTVDALNDEMKAAIDEDKTGEGFIFDMFYYELANHEYAYSGDLTDTLECLGLTMEEIEADERLLKGLKKAIRRQHQ